MNHPIIRAEVNEVNLYPGETMTVWMNAYGPNHEKREAVQVELRVVPGQYGKREIYISQKVGTAKVEYGFDDWYSMGDTNA